MRHHGQPPFRGEPGDWETGVRGMKSGVARRRDLRAIDGLTAPLDAGEDKGHETPGRPSAMRIGEISARWQAASGRCGRAIAFRLAAVWTLARYSGLRL